MATIGNLVVNLETRTAKFQKGLSRAQTRLGKFRRELGISEAAVRKFSLAAYAGGAAFAAWGVKLASATEQAQVAFETMLKSGEKATKLIEEIKSFAAVTPFKKMDLISSAQGLLAFGVEAENVMGDMKMLGDLAAGSGARISELTRIYGKVQAIGKSSLEQINQMAERGIPIYAALERQTGRSGDALRKYISTGKVSAAEYSRTLQSMVSEGGIFFGAMEAQSKTLAGRWSTLTDNIEALAESIGTELLPMVSSYVESMTGWIQANKSALVLSFKVAAGIGALALAVKGYTTATVLATNATIAFNGALALIQGHPVIAAITAFGAAALVTKNNVAKLNDELEKLGEAQEPGFWENTFTLPVIGDYARDTRKENRENRTTTDTKAGKDVLRRLEKQAAAERAAGRAIGGFTSQTVGKATSGIGSLMGGANKGLDKVFGKPKKQSLYEQLMGSGKKAEAERKKIAKEEKARVEKRNKLWFGKAEKKDPTGYATQIGQMIGGLSNRLTGATGDMAKRGVSEFADATKRGPGKAPSVAALDATSVEGYKALRANMRGQSPQKKIENLAKKQLAENKKSNSYLASAQEALTTLVKNYKEVSIPL